MRFALISTEGTSLSAWTRLVDEGEEVMAWIAPRAQRKIGLGLVPTTGSFEALAAWGMETPTVFVFDGNGQGDKADFLRRRGHLVVGGGSFCDKLEKEREWATQIAVDAGQRTPETIDHSSISQSISWLISHDDGRGWYFKSNKFLGSDATQGKKDVEGMVRYLEFIKAKNGDRIAHILQEKLDGVDISTAAYWTGSDWLMPLEGTVEHKRFMDGDVGPSTGCSFNAVWFYDDYPRIAQELHIHELAERFRRLEVPPGIYDINGFVSSEDRHARFLEWTPRFGYDAEPTAWRALTMPMGEFFYGLAAGKLTHAPFDTSTVQMSVRLSVSPYPWEVVDDIPEKKSCIGIPIWGVDGLWEGMFVPYGVSTDERGQLVVADPTGLLGLAATSGSNLESMNDEIMDFVSDDLDVAGLQYRRDADKRLGEHIDELRKLGYDVPHVRTLKDMERDGGTP